MLNSVCMGPAGRLTGQHGLKQGTGNAEEGQPQNGWTRAFAPPSQSIAVNQMINVIDQIH